MHSDQSFLSDMNNIITKITITGAAAIMAIGSANASRNGTYHSHSSYLPYSMEQIYVSNEDRNRAFKSLSKQFKRHVSHDGACKIVAEAQHKTILSDSSITLQCVGDFEFDEQVAIAVRKAQINLPAFRTIVWTPGFKGALSWDENYGRISRVYIEKETVGEAEFCFTEEEHAEPATPTVDIAATPAPSKPSKPKMAIVPIAAPVAKKPEAKAPPIISPLKKPAPKKVLEPVVTQEQVQLPREPVKVPPRTKVINSALDDLSVAPSYQPNEKPAIQPVAENDSVKEDKQSPAEANAAQQELPTPDSTAQPVEIVKQEEPAKLEPTPLQPAKKMHGAPVTKLPVPPIPSIPEYQKPLTFTKHGVTVFIGKMRKEGYVVELGRFANPININYAAAYKATVRTAGLYDSGRGYHILTTGVYETRRDAEMSLMLIKELSDDFDDARIAKYPRMLEEQ